MGDLELVKNNFGNLLKLIKMDLVFEKEIGLP
jgi:hypothetical protein